MSLPKRKHPRLKESDYSANGYSTVTICTKNRQQILSKLVGRGAHTPPSIVLTNAGKIVEKYIKNINTVYNDITVDCYCIMPNHIHLILFFNVSESNGGMWASRPTLDTVIRTLKTMVTKELKQSIWQKSFFDHIIRNEQDLYNERRYVEENPARWLTGDYRIR